MTNSYAVSKPILVIVLGMHRSGTSALCGALNLIGLDFGNQLLPATRANEKGHWEHEEIVSVHDRLLSSLGSSWDDPLPSGWIERTVIHEVKSELIEILERELGRTSVFGIKDPRMCRLMPLWLPIFDILSVEPFFILAVRSPWEVAESIADRDGIEQGKSELLWLEHVAEAEASTRGRKRSFVTYDALMDDPVRTMERLRNQLGVDLRPPSDLQASLREFLDPSLRHYYLGTRIASHTHPVSPLALSYYETIRNASSPHEISAKCKELAARFAHGCDFSYPPTVRTKKLSPEDISNVSLDVCAIPRSVPVSAVFWLDTKISNKTNLPLSAATPYPVRLAYHWIEKSTRCTVVFDGQRSGFLPCLGPYSTRRYPMKVVAPDHDGEYILQATIVQDGACWFEEVRPEIVREFTISVMAEMNDNTAVVAGREGTPTRA